MKGLLRRALSRLRNDKRGETLFESIVSILVFTILLVTVSLIVLVSFGVTGSANARAVAMNGEATATMTGNTAANIPTAIVIVFHDTQNDDHTQTVNVTVYESDDFGFKSFEYR